MSWAFTDDGRMRAGWRFVFGVVVALIANAAAVTLAGGEQVSMRRLDAVYRPLLALFLLLGFSLLLNVLDRLEGNPLEALGLGVRGPAWRGAGTGILLGAAMVAAAVAVIVIGGHVSFHWAHGHSARFLAVVLIILITGALAEELMFRSYPFLELEEAAGPMVAVAVTSALFGVVHLGNPDASYWAVANTFLIGILLALARMRTRALWMSWGIHFSWNATLGLVFGLPVSGLNEFAVIVRGQARGPVWLTGGKYGIEASAVGTAVIVAGMVAVIRWVRQRPAPAREVEVPVTGGPAA
jgi:membrane protease YdiL (CAAX protease family)